MTDPNKLDPHQKKLADLFDQHMAAEFGARSADQAVATMSGHPHIINSPTLVGGTGREEVHGFYANIFLKQIPADMQVTPVTRTVGNNTLVDEMICSFTHDIQMDWILPGIAPTGRKVEMVLVVVVGFKDGKVDYEHVYWDQASVLVQVGLLNPALVPAIGVEQAQRLRATIS